MNIESKHLIWSKATAISRDTQITLGQVESAGDPNIELLAMLGQILRAINNLATAITYAERSGR